MQKMYRELFTTSQANESKQDQQNNRKKLQNQNPLKENQKKLRNF